MKLKNKQSISNNDKEILSNKFNSFIDTFLKLCFDRTRIMASLGQSDKEFCNALLEEYSKLLKKYSKYDLNQLINYTKINSDIQTNLTNVLKDPGKRSSLNSYIDEFGEEIKAYLDQKIDKLYQSKFLSEDIEWIFYIITYIKNQIQIYLIVMDEADNNFNEKTNSFFTRINKLQSKLQSKVDKSTQKMQESTNIAISEARSVLPHLLTVVGIFVSIIIAVVAVYLNDLIKVENIEFYNNPQLLIARYIVSGHMIIDIILLLLYLIARITDKNILIRCGRFDKDDGSSKNKEDLKYYRPCALCKHNIYCNSFLKLWYKASYILLINFAFLLSYGVILSWWIIDKYIWHNIIYKIDKLPSINSLYNGSEVVFGVIILVLIIVFMLLFIGGIIGVIVESRKKFRNSITEQSKKKKNFIKKQPKTSSNHANAEKQESATD